MKDRSSQPCSHAHWLSLAVFVPILGTLAGADTAQAQSIVATPDGTGTSVTQQGTNTTITAGSHSSDGTNLFHSFESFSVKAGHSANFVADPSVQNVLSRVNGGESSVINGQLSVQVTEGGAGQPNLFFMNPAGVLIGPDAHLNLPGNLTVTTADAIGFEQGAFNATEPNNYATLNAAPTGEFVFNSAQPGSIVNQGEISVTPESSISLVGGSVVSTGDISAPGGSVSMIAVPGETTLQLRQPNSLLSLEVSVATNTYEQSATPVITPLALPNLLTYSEQFHANTLNVNADGTVRLETANETIPTIISSGSSTVSGNISVSAESEQAGETGGRISLLGDSVNIIEGSLSASGTGGGGVIHIGGDFAGATTLPTAHETIVGEHVQISANGLQMGDGGHVSIWADDTTQYLGEIFATGGRLSGNGGQVEVSGRESLLFAGGVDTRANTNNGMTGSLLLDPKNILITNEQPGADDAELTDYRIRASDGSNQLTISAAMLESLSENSSITLEATNNIIVEDLDDDTLTFSAAAGEITFTADADRDRNGSVIFSDRNDSLIAPGRSLNFSGKFLFLGNLDTSSPEGGGTITLNATSAIRTGDIDASSSAALGGGINLQAGSSITTGIIRTEGATGAGTFNSTSITNGISTEELFIGGNNNANLVAPREVLVDGVPFIKEPEITPEPEVTPDPEPPALESPDPSPSEERSFNGAERYSALFSQLSAQSSLSEGLLSGAASVSATESDSARYGVGRTVLSSQDADAAIAAIEGQTTQLFSDYFGRELAAEELSFADVQQVLANAERDTGSRSAVIYARAPQSIAEADSADDVAARIDDSDASALELLLFTATGEPIKITTPEVAADTLASTVEDFRADLATSARRGGDYYLPAAQQLYEWLVKPLENDLATAGIETLVFAMDEGLRTIPLAALHDGSSFLVEKYSLGTVPSLGMIDTQYASLDSSQVLAMGISDFGQFDRFNDLPGVPDEIKAIEEDWPGSSFLNERFTQQNLEEQRSQTPYQIIHLATHAQMNAGSIDNSYIQLWNEQLALGELSQLGWDSPAVQLLVLSACNTALDSPEAEMGFAGLAIASGVSSAMASLWSVSDLGTLALMDEFYTQLSAVPTKAEALQQAQLGLLQSEGEFSHPYYWSGFSMVGSPW